MIFQVQTPAIDPDSVNLARPEVEIPAVSLSESWNSFRREPGRSVSAETVELADPGQGLGDAACLPRTAERRRPGSPSPLRGQEAELEPKPDWSRIRGPGDAAEATSDVCAKGGIWASGAMGAVWSREALTPGRPRPFCRFMSTIPCQRPGLKHLVGGRPERNEGPRPRRRSGGYSVQGEV